MSKLRIAVGATLVPPDEVNRPVRDVRVCPITRPFGAVVVVPTVLEGTVDEIVSEFRAALMKAATIQSMPPHADATDVTLPLGELPMNVYHNV